MTKLMERKKRWARAEAAKLDELIAEIRSGIRALDRDQARRGRLLIAYLEAERHWILVSIRDGRSRANQRVNSQAARRWTQAARLLIERQGGELPKHDVPQMLRHAAHRVEPRVPHDERCAECRHGG